MPVHVCYLITSIWRLIKPHFSKHEWILFLVEWLGQKGISVCLQVSKIDGPSFLKIILSQRKVSKDYWLCKLVDHDNCEGNHSRCMGTFNFCNLPWSVFLQVLININYVLSSLLGYSYFSMKVIVKLKHQSLLLYQATKVEWRWVSLCSIC